MIIGREGICQSLLDQVRPNCLMERRESALPLPSGNVMLIGDFAIARLLSQPQTMRGIFTSFDMLELEGSFHVHISLGSCVCDRVYPLWKKQKSSLILPTGGCVGALTPQRRKKAEWPRAISIWKRRKEKTSLLHMRFFIFLDERNDRCSLQAVDLGFHSRWASRSAVRSSPLRLLLGDRHGTIHQQLNSVSHPS